MFRNMTKSFLKLSCSLNMSKKTKTFCETELKTICLLHQQHEKECLYLPITCSVCGKKDIQQSLLSQHLDPNTGDCDGSKAVCPFLALGCPEREVRFSIIVSHFSGFSSPLSWAQLSKARLVLILD